MDKVKKAWNWLRNSKPVRTAAQTAVALIGTNAVGLLDIDWVALASASGLAALLSILTNVANGTPLRDEPQS